MKKTPFGERKYREDDSRRKEKQEVRKDLRWLREHGTKDDLRAYLKEANDKLTDEQIEELIDEYWNRDEPPRRR